jgi:hypothetical protein
MRMPEPIQARRNRQYGRKRSGGNQASSPSWKRNIYHASNLKNLRQWTHAEAASESPVAQTQILRRDATEV